MKIFTLALVFALAGTAFAQVSNIVPRQPLSPQEIKARVDQTSGVSEFSAQTNGFSKQESRRRKGKFGPGDHPVFLLHINREFARAGETVEFNLVSMVNRPERNYQVYGMVLKPGPDGDYDGSQPIAYFNSETGNGFVRGATVGQFIRTHTRMFSSEEYHGRYQFSFLIYDDETGQLLQQIWTSVYLTNSGAFGRSYHIHKTMEAHNGLGMSGRFPVGVPIYYFIGVPKYGFAITGPDPSGAIWARDNGSYLEIPGRVQWNRDVAIDVMLWSPYTREAIIKPSAYVEPGVFQ